MAKDNLKITALTIDQLVEVLRKSGSREVSAETIKTDIAEGAPAVDGKINLMEYAAWLVKRLSGGN